MLREVRAPKAERPCEATDQTYHNVSSEKDLYHLLTSWNYHVEPNNQLRPKHPKNLLNLEITGPNQRAAGVSRALARDPPRAEALRPVEVSALLRSMGLRFGCWGKPDGWIVLEVKLIFFWP